MASLYKLIPAFLAAQAALVYWGLGVEHPPAAPALDQFPSALTHWTKLREDPIDPDTRTTLAADRLLSRTYRDADGRSAELLVAWFQSQRAGHSQPHSPQVCLPASGWSPVSNTVLSLPTGAGVIPVNRYIVADGAQRAVVLYWYQSARRVTAGEWASKLWLVADSVRDRRTDTALVRIVVEEDVKDGVEGSSDESSTALASGLARAVYPELRAELPHSP